MWNNSARCVKLMTATKSGVGRRGLFVRHGLALGLAAVMAAAFLGCGIGQRSAAVDDSAISAAVKAKLATVFRPIEAREEKQYDRGADKETISYLLVKSQNGVVTLTGEVTSNRAKTRAGEIAKSVPKVVRVENQLAVAPGYSDDAAGSQ